MSKENINQNTELSNTQNHNFQELPRFDLKVVKNEEREYDEIEKEFLAKAQEGVSATSL